MIKFRGVWNSDRNAQIEFVGPANVDEYYLSYFDVQNNTLRREKITIYISTSRHARLGICDRFMSRDIFILDENNITIDGEVYTRNSTLNTNLNQNT